jgi:hypothetical protein
LAHGTGGFMDNQTAVRNVGRVRFNMENVKQIKIPVIADYENKHYGKSHEFGGNVNEMLTDLKHYLFSFHDQFMEIIARGFWFEESEQIGTENQLAL